jgi:hypothetical protein
LVYNEICSKTIKVYPVSVEFCIGDTVGMSNIKTLSFVFVPGLQYTQKKFFRNSSAAEDVVTEEYFEKFFCCTKIYFVGAQIPSLQINILGLERISTLPEVYLRQ